MRFWTVEEARGYLPRLRELLTVIQSSVEPGPDPSTVRLRAGAEHAEAALAELDDKGIVLRHLASGLIDFPSRGPDGDIRLLCWQVDEEDLAWWHRPEDGYAGRRPLDGSDT